MAPSIQLRITQPNFNPAEKYLMSNSSSDNLPDSSIICLGKVSKIICVLFVENSTKGGGGLAVLQVLVRIFEKMLKVLQMLQFIQK